jgi:phosphatidylserine/phosphatidylglycerophosphate/cardiolipin synthase-like enzyme
VNTELTDDTNRERLQLAEVAIGLTNASGLEIVCAALESGRLSIDSTAVIRAALASGNAEIELQIRKLLRVWSGLHTSLSAKDIAMTLQASAAGVQVFRRIHAEAQSVWTGPKVEGSFLRATREVVREILRGATEDLIVVGYWIAARDDGDGIIEEAIASLAEAVSKGVSVTVIVDGRARFHGRDNRSILVSAWPAQILLPKILTWRVPADDVHLKLHAKVLVADHRDALVTSANFTSYAMDRNMEMGVRVVGQLASNIARHFELLESQGILETFDDNWDHT